VAGVAVPLTPATSSSLVGLLLGGRHDGHDRVAVAVAGGNAVAPSGDVRPAVVRSLHAVFGVDVAHLVEEAPRSAGRWVVEVPGVGRALPVRIFVAVL